MATLDTSNLEGIVLIRLAGSLTQQGVEGVEGAFADALPDGARAVVDLDKVDLITTPGLTMIIATTQRLRGTRGRIVFTGARAGVLDLLRRCRLDEVIDLADSRQAAIALAKTAWA